MLPLIILVLVNYARLVYFMLVLVNYAQNDARIENLSIF